MEIVCEKCKRKLNVSENKVPKDRVAYLKCPGCENRITIGGSSPEKKRKEEESSFTLEDLNSATYDASEKPFDFIEEEGKTSLVCISDKETNAAVSADLSRADFHKIGRAHV